jgi:hypothetical protein
MWHRGVAWWRRRTIVSRRAMLRDSDQLYASAAMTAQAAVLCEQ